MKLKKNTLNHVLEQKNKRFKTNTGFASCQAVGEIVRGKWVWDILIEATEKYKPIGRVLIIVL